MSDKSGIEWTDATWNPVTGCAKVSAGCDHCYAETFAERFRGTPGHHFEQGFDVVLRPERLDIPLRWTKPRRIFVNSMSDLFHDDIPDEFIACVFHVMERSPRHVFQLLTKRHARMRSLLTKWATGGRAIDFGYLYEGRPKGAMLETAPLWTPAPNVWLGVSVENQQWADIRIPALINTPAAVRFLSCEPLLGPVNLTPDTHSYLDFIDWVIVGGESGRGARPMHPAWARSIRDECETYGVPFLFKQWGEWRYAIEIDDFAAEQGLKASGKPDPFALTSCYTVGVDGSFSNTEPPVEGNATMMRVGKRKAGRELDGRTWDEYPAGAA